METANSTPRPAQVSDAERLQQESNYRLRETKKKQDEEMRALVEKHERDMKTTANAFRVELGAQQEEFTRKMDELNSSQAQRLAQLSQQNEINLKQAQDTYRLQADQLRIQGEKKLSSIREEQLVSNENITKKGKA
ncbi:MAG: hypothetical protein AB7K68_13025 [Bacteriovoracia bacterium]